MTKTKAKKIKRLIKERGETITLHAKKLKSNLQTLSLFLAGGFKSKRMESYFDELLTH